MSDESIEPPAALVLGCNTPHGIGVLSDWIEERTGHAPDFHSGLPSDSPHRMSNSKNRYGDGSGFGRGNGNGWGDGCGYGFTGYITPHATGNGAGEIGDQNGDGYGDGQGYGDGNGDGFFGNHNGE